MGKEGGPNFILEERAYTTPKTTIEKIKQHFGHCFEITNFDEEMARGQKRFVTAINLLSKKEAFYGTNDGTNIRAVMHIV